MSELTADGTRCRGQLSPGPTTLMSRNRPGHPPSAAALALGAMTCLGLFSATSAGQDQSPSPWYLERGTELRDAGPADDVPRVLKPLVELMRDHQVPGFYDGQFAGLSGDYEELARLVSDETVEHTLRLMAVMALQEAGDGEILRARLEPLLISVEQEFSTELNDFWVNGDVVSEGYVRGVLQADLSRHVRFALAKDGQTEAVRAKIRVMEQYVWKDHLEILDPSISSDKDPAVALKRGIWFNIAYHYQQFDDYTSAARWYGMLCDNLRGDETRWPHYNLACIAAIQGQSERALGELQAAFEAGFLDVSWMLKDGDLAILRGSPGFLELARRMGADASKIEPNPDGSTSPEAGDGSGRDS